MAVQTERQLLPIDPRTVEAGVVEYRNSFLSGGSCPLAKDRDGNWYTFRDTASRFFNLHNLEEGLDGKKRMVNGYTGMVKKAYERYYNHPKDREQVVLGVAARVVRLAGAEIEYNLYDLGLWVKIGENDGLGNVRRIYKTSDGLAITAERIK